MSIQTLEGCCGVGEIQYVGSMGGPKEALKTILGDFVEHNYGGGGSYYSYAKGCYVDEPEKESFEWLPMDGHLVFTEVAKVTRPQQIQVGYGKKLAALIKKEKLGSVIVSKPRKNAINHPDHILKVYVWTPNERACKAWAKKNGVFSETYASAGNRY